MAASISLVELDAQIAAERAAIHAYLDEHIIPLMVRRRLLAEKASAASPQEDAGPLFVQALDASPKTDPDPAPLSGEPAEGVAKPPRARDEDPAALARRLRSSAAWSTGRIVMSMLEDASAEGVPPNELDSALLTWGYYVITGITTRTRLRSLGAIALDPRTGNWVMTEAYKAGIPPGTRIALGDPDWGDAPPPGEQTAGRIILQALREGPSTGLPRQALVDKVVAAGFTASLCDSGIRALALTKAIVRSATTNLWTLKADEEDEA